MDRSSFAVFDDEANRLQKGLSGRRIVITRALHQASDMVKMVEGWGGIAVKYPCIAVHQAEDRHRLDGLLREAAAGKFDLMVVTSANTASFLSENLSRLNLFLGDIEVWAIGPITAQAVKDHLGLEAAYVAARHVAEGLVEGMPDVRGRLLLLPQSSIARPYLAEALKAAGAQVTAVTAYQPGIGQGGDDVPGMLTAGRIDAVTFASPSAVRNFLLRHETEGSGRSPIDQLLGEVCLAAIGPVTAEALESQNLRADVMPAHYTTEDLVNSLVGYFANKD